MADLSTTYLGLNLKNPIIVTSSSLVMTEEGIRKCQDAGAGAVVLKSLFEEQILLEREKVEAQASYDWHSEAYEYISKMSMEFGPESYLRLIESCKKNLEIPVIASLNCVNSRWWGDYARKIEAAGADALELNVAYWPSDSTQKAEEVERVYLEILDKVKQSVKLPIAMKIGPYFSSLAHLVHRIDQQGVNALVLFNRFYQFDLDPEKMELVPGYLLSTRNEAHLPLRWISMLSGNVKCDLAASTGIHDGMDVVKQILAGAMVTGVCSTLFINGIDYIRSMLTQLESWMNHHHYTRPDQFRGKLSRAVSRVPEDYERLQYIQALVGVE